ncbi:MAG: ornithine carbamoyltransferase [Dehalococcoidales bacterium]|nr:ornithine carbamoyltransferase [Dehalococcoidales bacterium]
MLYFVIYFNVEGFPVKDLISIAGLSSEYVISFIHDAIDMKRDGWRNILDRKILALMFEKPSLRTRVSFEVAMKQLGGTTIYLSPAEVGLGKREAVSDVARVLSRFADVIAARTFSHETVTQLAQYSSVPVINALSDEEHPCQALADLLTIYEKKGDFKKLTLAYIGDGNNVANSLLLGTALTGMNFRIASPEGYDIKEKYLKMAQNFAAESGTEITCLREPQKAVENADIVYTDVWTSMGQEEEAELRRKTFAGYQVNEALMKYARPDAIIMHDLPAHYGEEVAPGILDSPQSVVFDEAENRMHAQKILLVRLAGGGEIPMAGYGLR